MILDGGSIMEVIRTLEDPGMFIELGCDKQDLIDTLLFAREQVNAAEDAVNNAELASQEEDHGA